MTTVEVTTEISALTRLALIVVEIRVDAELGAPPDPTIAAGVTVTMTHAETDRLTGSPTWYTATWLRTKQSVLDTPRFYVRSAVGAATSSPAGPGALTLGTWWQFVHIVTPSEDLILRAARPIIVR